MIYYNCIDIIIRRRRCAYQYNTLHQLEHADISATKHNTQGLARPGVTAFGSYIMYKCPVYQQ